MCERTTIGSESFPVSIPSFGESSIHSSPMDPKTLRLIADKACIFDRAHFDDGNVPDPETFLRHHETLKTDRKLITRLVPRYAVALGFFEGYVQAMSEREPSLSRDAVLMDLSRTRERIASLAAFANATEVRDTAAKLVQDSIDKIMKSDSAIDVDSIARNLVSELSEMENDSRVVGEDSERARERRAARVKERIESIGIVIRPPPPPPPPAAPPMPNEISDELVRAAVDFANATIGKQPWDRGDDLDYARTAIVDNRGFSFWTTAARQFVHGARWQLSTFHEWIRRTTEQAAEWRDAAEKCEAERMQYEKTIKLQRAKIAEYEAQLARVDKTHAGDDPTMHFPPAFDRASMPSDEEIARFVRCDLYKLGEDHESISRIADLLGKGSTYLFNTIQDESGSDAEACAIKLALLRFMPHAKEDSNGAGKLYVEDGKVMFQGSSGRATNLGSPEGENEPAAPLVFRDENERDFWDEQVHALNRRGDRTSSDVASAADEMVEERRKRMPMEADRPETIPTPSDELLLEAARYADTETGRDTLNDETQLKHAKDAMDNRFDFEWHRICRHYLDGALRKSRTT